MLTPPEIEEEVRKAIEKRHLSVQTERSYQDWIYRYILFHNNQHPIYLGAAEASSFLTYLANERQVAASTQNQAYCALLFLYQQVLHQPLPKVSFPHIKSYRQLPTIFTRQEVKAILAHLRGIAHLMAALLYGAGLRLSEALQLRVRDINFDGDKIMVPSTGAILDRQTLLPGSLRKRLRGRVRLVKEQWLKDFRFYDLKKGVTNGQNRLSPDPMMELGKLFLFPGTQWVQDSTSGNLIRNHLHQSYLQRAVRNAIAAAGLDSKGNCHSLRHSFALHMLEDGCNIKTLQRLLGHRDIRSTMIYTHLIPKKNKEIKSPLDVQ